MSNRPIKFRAWSQVSSQMTKPFELEWLKFNTPVPDDFEKRMGFADDLIFQQFTGLTDKNGKEIYEGDIVKILGYNNKNWEVRWQSSFSGFNLQTKQNNWYGIGEANGRMEVIGNIYENKELLNNESL